MDRCQTPLLLNTCTRLLPSSPIQILPLESILMPWGLLNWPLAVLAAHEPDAQPSWLTYTPPALNFCTRLLFWSTTQILPDESTAMPRSLLNWPLAVPLLPNWER